MNIATIMANVIPGSFVPDMNAAETPAISAIPGLTTPNVPSAADAVGGVTSFKDTVKQMLGDVNDRLTTSDQNTRDLAAGKTNNINKVVTSVEEANLALQYTMAIRTKLLDAYSEIERLAV